ncbi:GFA family protein [Paraburkholderia kirstenboschensis]
MERFAKCNVDPVATLNCHCWDCQKASGATYASTVAGRCAMPRCQIRGKPRHHRIVDAAGKAVDRGFSRPAAAK